MTYDIQARCISCKRYLKVKAMASSQIVVRCEDRKCKKDNVIKIVMMSDHNKQHIDSNKNQLI